MIEVILNDTRWLSTNLEAIAHKSVAVVLAALDIDVDHAEIAILGCDDVHIANLNADFRDKPVATNVLSWPAEERAPAQRGGIPDAPTPGPDGMIELGDIAISYDTCVKEAAAAGKSIEGHVTHLIIHGLLHLLGYDHTTDPDAELMERVEVEILGKLGHDDPYSDSAVIGTALTQRRD